MSESRREALIARIEGAARDMLCCAARLRAGADADYQTLLEAAGDAHTDALELSFAEGGAR